MERIASIIQQLQDAFNAKADAAHLLMLSNMLHAELEQIAGNNVNAMSTSRVAVVLPASKNTSLQTEKQIPETGTVFPEPVKEKIIEVLKIDESEVEAELEEIRQKAEFAKKMQAKQTQHKPALLFDEEPEVPTLIHQPNYVPGKVNGQKEINDLAGEGHTSLNDKLKEEKKEVSEKLGETSGIKDLKKAISINDRFIFIQELFRGDEAMYERSIKTINNFTIYPEAQYWIERELKIKLGWDNERPATKEFYALVKRRFS